MIFINPQWQGSGLTDELKFGAETLDLYFNNYEKKTIPLSGKKLTTIDNIKCYQPILEQISLFRQILADSNLKKVSTIGGDCGVEIVPISYLNTMYRADLCIVYTDAHADLNTPDSSPSKAFHGITNCQYAEIENKIKDFKNVYIHLDLDVLDKSEYEFSMFPTTNKGFLVSDVAHLIEKIKRNHHVVGFCITESTATTLEQLEPIKSLLDQIEI